MYDEFFGGSLDVSLVSQGQSNTASLSMGGERIRTGNIVYFQHITGEPIHLSHLSTARLWE